MTRVIVWTDAIPESTLGFLGDLIPDGYELRVLPAADQHTAMDAVADADYLVSSGSVRITGELLDRAPRVRYLQKLGVGTDVLDLDALRARGIPAANTTNVNHTGVAEHIVLLMLSILRLLPVMDHRLRSEGRWTKWDLRPRCFELADKTVGLVGFGSIGQAVAQRLHGFETTVRYFRRNPLDREREHELNATYLDLDELIATSDIISLSVPLTPETRHLINRERLRAMKPRSYLINTSRGGVVDEEALIEALQNGQIGGAGLDVFDPEPPSVDNPLFALDNVVVTPHTGGATIDTFRKTFGKAMDNIQRVDAGGSPHDEDVLISGPARAIS